MVLLPVCRGLVLVVGAVVPAVVPVVLRTRMTSGRVYRAFLGEVRDGLGDMRSAQIATEWQVVLALSVEHQSGERLPYVDRAVRNYAEDLGWRLHQRDTAGLDDPDATSVLQ